MIGFSDLPKCHDDYRDGLGNSHWIEGAFQSPSIHALTPANFLISLRLEAAKAAMASRAFSKASFTVSASVMS